jgi:alkyl hydroperoxide reductase subunit AhpC
MYEGDRHSDSFVATKSINEISQVNLQFPIIADPDRKIATLYDMLDEQDATNKDTKGIPFTVRTVYVIDPKKSIRLLLAYPASTGRNFDESELWRRTCCHFAGLCGQIGNCD